MDKEGVISTAKGDTIFLAEIDNLSLKSQTALLRLLQESQYRPIGSSQINNTSLRKTQFIDVDMRNSDIV